MTNSSRFFLPAVAALVLTMGVRAAVQTPTQSAPSTAAADDQPLQPAPPGDDFPLFPIGPGRDLVLKTCSKCHELEKLAMQELDKPGWKRLLDDMANQGASATDEEFEKMAQYLSKAFPLKP